MDIRQGLRAAARIGARAGAGYRATGLPRRNPFAHDGPGAMPLIAQAWDRAYAIAAYAAPPGSPHPTFDAIVPGAADSAGQTATMTAAGHIAPAAAARAAEAAQLGGADPDDEWRAARKALTAAGEPNTGACLMAFLSAGDAARLAVPGGDPPEEMHVTLAYLALPAAEYTPEQRAQVDGALRGALTDGAGLPVPADAFAVAHFNPDSDEREPCAVLLVQSAELAALRGDVVSSIEAAGAALATNFPIWVPHVTIGYNLDPALLPPGVTGPLSFDRLVMAWGDDQHDLTSPAPDDAALTAATEEPPMTSPAAPAAPAADPAAADPASGPTWSGPLALLGVASSDGRKLGPNGTVRPLPQPLNWQEKSDGGHRGSSVVGGITQVEIRDGMIWGHGDWLPGWGDVEKARTQVDAGLGLISVDVVPGEVSYEDRDGNPIDPNTFTGDYDDIVVVFDFWEFGGATIVSFPAFADARISTDPGTGSDDDIIGGPYIMPGEPQAFAGDTAPAVSADGMSVTLADGSVVAVGDTVSVPSQDGAGATATGTITEINTETQLVDVSLPGLGENGEPVTVSVPVADLTPAAAPAETALPAAPAFAATAPALAGPDGVDSLLASSYGHPYRAGAFAKRELLGPTPLTLDRETREVYGHFATRGECHIGKLAQDGVCVTAPESQCGYDYFHLGEVLTDDGPLPVGKITVGGGHAGPRAGFRGAVEHYDRTCAQVAVVRAYDDEWGGQFTGMLIHDVPQERVEEMMRAGQLSGDWRTMKGHLELVAALAVNVPGFPVKRPTPKYGMLGDRQVSLVAAGVVAPEDNTEVVLPSGLRVPRDDWEALTAACYTAFTRHQAPPAEAAALPAVDQLALRRARARLALLDTAGV